MGDRTIRHAKRDLAAAFPGLEFVWSVSGRGRSRGPCCTWQGGPTVDEVKAVADLRASWRRRHSMEYHFFRQMTDAERVVYDAEQQAKWDAWDAEAPAREAAHKLQVAANRKAGAAKSAITRRQAADTAKLLADNFPGVGFSPSRWGGLRWMDGPEVAAVAKVMQLDAGRCERRLSPACVTANRAKLETDKLAARPQIIADRLRRRLLRSISRNAMVAKIVSQRGRQGMLAL
jgi:hypothetical protein